MDSNVIIGISLMLLATTLMNIGQVIQKKAVDTLPPLEQQSTSQNVKGIVTNKRWLFGWILTTLAMVLNWLALGYVDMSITQPLIAWGLVVLVIFSRIYLKEEITKKEGIGIGLAVLGVILLGLTSDFAEQPSDLVVIAGNYLKPAAITCFIAFYIAIVLLWISSVKSQYKNAGVNFALISAFFSVLGLTFSKGSSQALNILGFSVPIKVWWVWALLIIFMIHSTMAIATQQMSYQKGKAVVVTPIFNLGSIILPLFTGYFVFNEPIGIYKIISMVIIVAGAFLLSYKKKEA